MAAENKDVDCECAGSEFGPPSVNIAETRTFPAGPMMGTKFSRLTFLGTSSACPSPLYRNVSAMALSLSTGSVILCDCGEGTQHQIMRSATVRMSKLDLILITHLHGDHVFGIFGLLCTMTMRGRTEPVTIVGPKGIKNMVHTTLLAQGGFYTYPLHFIELNDERDNKPIDLGKLTDGIQVTAYPLKHKVTTFGYTLQEPPRPGALDPVKARALGAANQQLSTLKSGQDVTLADGRVVRSADCVSPPTPGRIIAIVQDTYAPLDSAMVQGAQGADIVVHEATYHRPLEQKAIAHGHSTADMAGQFAARVGAKILALTHFSSRYSLRGQSSPPSAQELVSLCKKVSGEANSKPPAARLSDEEFKKVASGSESNDDLFVDDLVFEAKASCPDVQVVAAADFLAIESAKDQWAVLEQADLTKDPVQAK